jgi:Flp pilus assembly protein TadD
MFQSLFHPSESARLFALAASTAILALGLCGCQLTSSDVTGSLGDKAETGRSADPRRDVDLTAERYRANPRDAEAALRYGKALRATGQKSQAVAVLEQATIANADNKALIAGYGRALADNGNFQQAFDVLGRAHTPDNPDWRILSAQGAVLDQLGRFEEARQYYSSALKITPDEPAVLSAACGGGCECRAIEAIAVAQRKRERASADGQAAGRFFRSFRLTASERRRTEAMLLAHA